MPLVKKHKQSTSRSDAALQIHLDQGNKYMECRLMQRTETEHRFERVVEADKAGYFTTLDGAQLLPAARDVFLLLAVRFAAPKQTRRESHVDQGR
jgi:hypothetical protein